MPHTPGVPRSLPAPSERAPGITPARRTPSQVSSGLRPAGHVARGLLLPRSVAYVRVSPRHSHPARAGFPQAERRSSRVPLTSDFSPSGTVSRRASLASATCSRLSWLSSSRPPFIGRSPDAWPSGPSRRRERKSPRQPRCAGVIALTPRTGFSPALCHYGLLLEGSSLSPPFGDLHRIERPGCAPHLVGAAFGRASLRRTGRAPLDASGSTGRHEVGGSRGG